MSLSSRTEHDERRRALLHQFVASEQPVALGKRTSNLFRSRTQQESRRLDVSGFSHVLAVNTQEGWTDVEGMATYETVVYDLLQHGVMPAVVPELKTITVGGAVSGVGIESSSFKYGLVHETVLELDVLTGAGEIVTASPTNEHKALFFSFPNSYGSLGYALRVRIRTVSIEPFVHLKHERFSRPADFFTSLARAVEEGVHFLDGVVFSPNELVLTRGTFVSNAPYISSYMGNRIYYQSLRQRGEDFLTTKDYIWRWDTDWFWQSKLFGVQNPLIRTFTPKAWLGSKTYTKLMRLNSRWGVTDRLQRWTKSERESVIQDVDIPLGRAAEFLEFFRREIRILPIWVCPIRSATDVKFPLYPVQPGEIHVNFGFWSSVPRRGREDGYYNRLIEKKVTELGGIKSLYSTSYFPEEEFWTIYSKPAYDTVKATYDPSHRFKNLYEKAVQRH